MTAQSRAGNGVVQYGVLTAPEKWRWYTVRPSSPAAITQVAALKPIAMIGRRTIQCHVFKAIRDRSGEAST